MLDVLNRYIHGYVALPVILACYKNHIFDLMDQANPPTLDDIAKQSKANVGSLAIAFNMFESLGWIENIKNGYYTKKNITTGILNDIGTIPPQILSLYAMSSHTVIKNTKLFKKWINYCLKNRSTNLIINECIEGALLIPLFIALNNEYNELDEELFITIPLDLRKKIIKLFLSKGWVQKEKKSAQLTPPGRFLIERAYNGATAMSYAPMLNKIEDILFGNPNEVFRKNVLGHESHLDRQLNVIASGFQHKRYFEDFVHLMIPLFDQERLENQPKYLIDTGCGDGTLLKTIYEAICSKTIRGQHLKEYPLFLIGVDFNKKALRETKKTLQGYPHYTLKGDIGNPKKIINDLKKLGLKEIENALHIRSFLDHDRPFLYPRNKKQLQERSRIPYEGAYMDSAGNRIAASDVIQSLVEHLTRWASVIEKHGLMVMEVHCLKPSMIYQTYDQQESFHFDILQAFSQQYLVSAYDFIMSAAEAGLFSKTNFRKKYPQNFSFTRITSQYLEKKDYIITRAHVKDIPALIQLERSCWPEKLCGTTNEIETRIKNYPEGQLVLKIKNSIVAVIYTQKIANTDQLKNIMYKDILSLHEREGCYLQLLGIFVKPELQGRGLGEELRDFSLYGAALSGDIAKVIGVTRCSEYKNHNDLKIESYIEKHLSDSDGIDKTLRFHTSRGAKITSIIQNYRPDDIDNQGTGILIEYDIQAKPRFDIKTLGKITAINQPKHSIETIIKNQIIALLPDVYKNSYDQSRPLQEMGFDSLRLLELKVILMQLFNVRLDSVFFFEHSTPVEIIKYFSKYTTHQSQESLFQNKINLNHDKDLKVAIIGMGCRLGSDVKTPNEFWQLLNSEKNIITRVPDGRWVCDEIVPDYINYGGFIRDVDQFDAQFFHISPREATLMDPQQRMLLEVSWEAFENAGIAANTLRDTKTGVFVGTFTHDYERLLAKSSQLEDYEAYFATGNSEAVIAGRISYVFGLQGPSMTVNTACSSSLVAVHLACQSLQRGESNLAIAGGVNLILSPELSMTFAKAGMLSTDKLCKTFDKDANGYVRGEGCGVIVLKRLTEALNDQDNILGVILGSAVNQDGASNGLTAPNATAQERLLKEALSNANVEPETISYIETHGTGTILGDPIEVKAINKIYGKNRSRENPLYLGSVKSKIGHTEAAAGIAGLIKIILSLQKNIIPKQFYFKELNPNIEIGISPIIIPNENLPWQLNHYQFRRAGISSFGFSGTNAHIIIEEAPQLNKNNSTTNEYCLLTLTAKTESALKTRISDLVIWLENQVDKLPLSSISYTLNVGRQPFEKRCAIVSNSLDDLTDTLKMVLQGKLLSNVCINKDNQLQDQEMYTKKLNHLIEKLLKTNLILEDEIKEKLLEIGNLFIKGCDIDWNLFYKKFEHKISLPTYPFEKKRFWIKGYNLMNEEKTQRTFNREAETITPKLSLKKFNNVDVHLEDKVQLSTIKRMVCEIVKQVLYLSDENIDDQVFIELGVDSILSVEIVKKINEKLNSNFKATIIYDYPTVIDLSEYILKNSVPMSKVITESTLRIDDNLNIDCALLTSEEKKTINSPTPSPVSDIAIIGFSGRFPDANNTDEYWENLKNGKFSIKEVPENRWRIDECPCKWGGFLDDFDKFDPLFFNISPAEAEVMDPQQRLFLEECWKAVEVAGYNPESISDTRCGVFVGVSTADYINKVIHSGITTAQRLLGNNNSILAARISYILNLKGPSVSIDTACSSSLVSIHMACQSILAGESDLALAGGVCIAATSDIYKMTFDAGMLSSEGKCKTFDNTADGFVPGEAVGVILLKPLDKAVMDQDTIYAVIKGSAINQDGKTNGITAPSSNAQSDLELSVYKKFNINPETIQYIEAHGTGTKLGDPIEIEALKHSFKNYTNKINFCAIGSVKTNIGHAMAAAGIASVIKTLLCLYYKKIVPTLNFSTENEHLHLANSPFYVNTILKNWDQVENYPRRAAVSSFGFSGTNAHLVMEEHQIKNTVQTCTPKPYYLVTLSAKTENSFEKRINDIVFWLDNQMEMPSLEAISYTFNTGRSHFEWRCALVVNSISDLKTTLKNIINKKQADNYILPNQQVKHKKEVIFEELLLNILKDVKNYQETLLDDQSYLRKLIALGELYVKGYDINWKMLHKKESNKRISLPTYPFEKNRYWVVDTKEIIPQQNNSIFHPLLDLAIPTLEHPYCFSKHLRSDDFYLNDHRINNIPLLPGVAYLEMARAAANIISPQNKVIGLSNVVWMRPITLENTDSTLVKITLFPIGTDDLRFEVMTHTADPLLHAQGKIHYGLLPTTDAETVDLTSIQSRCPNILTTDIVYERIKSKNLYVGPSLQTIQTLWCGEYEALVKLQLPDALIETSSVWTLHPSLLDGLPQALIGFATREDLLNIPFTLGQLTIFSNLEKEMYAHIERSVNEQGESKKYHFKLTNLTGKVLLKISDFIVRPANAGTESLYYYHAVWREEKLSLPASAPRGTVLILGMNETLKAALIKRINLSLAKTIEDLPRFILYFFNRENTSSVFSTMFLLFQKVVQANSKAAITFIGFYQNDSTEENNYISALSGFLKTASQENQHWHGRLVGLDKKQYTNVELLSECLIAELAQTEIEVRYQENQRTVKRFEPLILMEKDEQKNTIFREYGVYLITGGAGGLGLIFAEYLARNYQAKLLLMGRSFLNEEQKKKMQDLKSLGADVLYIQGDVSKRADIINVLYEGRTRFGKLNGIIHSAGIIHDAFIIKKKLAETESVIAPKIQGALLLDELTQEDTLDYFILFSSIASVFGNVGQCDYAYANAFIDAFAIYRNNLFEHNQRKGKTLSINWPLWKEGGMQVDDAVLERLISHTGLNPLSTQEGITAFEKLARLEVPQVIVAKGSAVKIRNFIDIQNQSKIFVPNDMTPSPEAESNEFTKELVILFSEILKINAEKIDIGFPLSKYGLDSVMMMSVLNKVEKKYGITVEASALIDNQTIKDFAKYLLTKQVIPHQGKIKSTAFETNQYSSFSSIKPEIKKVHLPQRAKQKVAVIGMAGRFPGSSSLEIFWEHLQNEKELITEIVNRDWTDYYSSNKSTPYKSYSKWGGLIENREYFSAEFFGISSDDAIMMDPSQRLLLELTQELFDRSGYERHELSGRKVGVFIGGGSSTYHDYYKTHILDAWYKHYVVHSIPNMLAARITDFYNLYGPALTVDTACSSSLVAVHQACQSILSGESDLAIAGGVEILISPELHIRFSKADVLSDDGKCYVFDERAKGMTLGEGLGLVFLKEYEQALNDGDRILGIILSSAINNDGRTPGITVPNPKMQEAVIQSALEKGNVLPETISYYEAHGTGTLLGDPIEIKAMSEVYRRYTNKKSYCAVGSVKSNIGHLLHAAGVASLIKVLLAFKNKIIPATLNCEQPHPRFQFDNSPFYPITKSTAWEVSNEKRRAAISSFGFGGTNCHVILEEGHSLGKRTPLPITPMERKFYWLGSDFVQKKESAPVTHQMKLSEDSKVEMTGISTVISEYLLEKLTHYLGTIPIDVNRNVVDLGIDSNQLIKLTTVIENEIGIALYPTLFFEYQTVHDITQYFVTKYKNEFVKALHIPLTALTPSVNIVQKTIERDTFINTPKETTSSDIDQDDIAVIGMSGIFADSSNLDEFWENIKNKKNLITEIPLDHWDYKPWYHPNPGVEDKIYCKWGSFIKDIDKFDAAFFNVLPIEAEMMDPQLRLLLQVLYATVEDAGLANKIYQSNTGVYIGSCFHDYQQEFDRLNKPTSPYDGIGNAATMLANRPSFFFDLKGPSLTIDTACSSSLVALHVACQALKQNECEMAFVGAANLLLSSWHYRYFCKIGALSHTGRCHTFDKAADGYVPGEGVAAVLLKPLKKALTDNDQIHAVIKGTAINHGGYTPSVTAPSVNQESEVMIKAWKASKVDPATITYIEAHGTGTKLGDPIEINAMNKAFADYSKVNHRCAIGSVKAHIGHTEGAAGIAGLIKVILSMKHKKIPAMPYFSEINPYMELSNSPLYINQEVTDWVTQEDTRRRAGVSSFGFGGAYAHAVIEEAPMVKTRSIYHPKPYYILTLSAKTEETLKQLAVDLTTWLNKQNPLPSLEAICYTLNVGREHFNWRCAFIVNSISDLEESLVHFIQHKSQSNILFSIKNDDKFQMKIEKEMSKQLIEVIADVNKFTPIEYRDKLLTIANLYVEGHQINWDSVHSNESKQRISLPTYAFTKERHWITPILQNHSTDKSALVIHPLLDKNISTFDRPHCFEKLLQRQAFYLRDHQVQHVPILPGVAYLEMALAAGSILSPENKVIGLSNVVWLRPITFTEESTLTKIHLSPVYEGVEFEITTGKDEVLLHAQGKINFAANLIIPPIEAIDLSKIKSHCDQTLTSEEVYERFDSKGLQYGPTFQTIQTLWCGEKEAIAKLHLPKSLVEKASTWILHPSLLDGALQTVSGLSKEEGLYLPFSLGQLTIFADLPEEIYVYAKYDTEESKFKKFIIQLIDTTGKVLVHMRDFIVRGMQNEKKEGHSKSFKPTEMTVNNSSMLLEKIHQKIIEMLANVLKIKTDDLDVTQEFSEYGMDSISTTLLIDEVNDYYQLELTPAILFEHNTLASVASYLVNAHRDKLQSRHPIISTDTSSAIPQKASLPINNSFIERSRHCPPPESNSKGIAIIGMSGILPGAANLDEFWYNLINGLDVISEVPQERWNFLTKTPVKWGGFIQGIDQFDAEFFNISPREAELMDPQHRLFLETVWRTIEDAGYTPHQLSPMKPGIFVGVCGHDYSELLQDVDEASAYSSTGRAHSILANRISYLLNWTGPSEAIDTACSSSLVAIHHAIKAIETNDCEIAIAGGVNAILTPRLYLSFADAGMLCEDGRCKTFDAAANGYVRGEGVGALLLKPLAKALQDGDFIYGVIKGSAVNHGGHVSSLTVPNPNAQSELLVSAYERSGIDANTVSYIETHGTGTALGDPIEVNGLKKAFANLGVDNTIAYCGLGTVKTHIGHLEGAAGIAGVIKVLLAMQHSTLPGNLHFKTLNPYIELNESPFYIVNKTVPWNHLKDSQGDKIPYRAGVSSFGFGGSNAHIVIEEAPKKSFISLQSKPFYLLTFSARTEAGLNRRIADLNTFLDSKSSLPELESISYTLNTGRKHFEWRAAIVVSNLSDLKDTLKQLHEMKKPGNSLVTMEAKTKPQNQPLFKELAKQLMSEIIEVAQLSAYEYRDKLLAIGNLYIEGYEIDWDRLHQNEAKQRIPLPTYPFSKDRYWVSQNVQSKRSSSQSLQMTNPSVLIVDEKHKSKKFNIQHETEEFLKIKLSESLKIPSSKIRSNETFEKYGADSVMILNLTRQLEELFGELSKTLFFEYNTIEELSAYLIEHFNEKLIKLLNLESKIASQITSFNNTNYSIKSNDIDNEYDSSEQDDIAIIGLSGRFPGADNLEEFWKNLKNGKNCVTEIPTERWISDQYYETEKDIPMTSYCKWGGFINDVDKFDTNFFDISLSEASLMDPQERLFLETTWHTIEDAGYTRNSLSHQKVGTFVGVMYGQYQLFGTENSTQLKGLPSSFYASIANRVSHFFNFTGPSIALDTMCSSSLSAIHLACMSIKNKECDMAIAGGVNISIHPNKYLLLSQGKLISSDGKCHSFGEGGDGYVPGEGVGAVLLKSLKQALIDRDHIYAIIKGSSFNHNGKTMSFTVPHPRAQTDLIKKTLHASKIDPNTISYIEAHGTGTLLGDSIEIVGLNNAFNERTIPCAIGSVKSNIGHLEAASGIAALAKVILQIQHRQLVPSLHSETLNPNINFDKSIFKVQRELKDWPSDYPRRAGISCFGAGGANAHIILEEFPEKTNVVAENKEPELFIFSAKNKNRLDTLIHDYIKFLKRRELDPLLADIAYTLQIGREAMKCRLAIISSSQKNLLENLIDYSQGKPNNDILFGEIRNEDDSATHFLSQGTKNQFLNLMNQKKLVDIAKLWISGVDFDWASFYQNNLRKRISLLPYPFDKKRCWITEEVSNNKKQSENGENRLSTKDYYRYLDVLKRLKKGKINVSEALKMTDKMVMN